MRIASRQYEKLKKKTASPKEGAYMIGFALLFFACAVLISPTPCHVGIRPNNWNCFRHSSLHTRRRRATIQRIHSIWHHSGDFNAREACGLGVSSTYLLLVQQASRRLCFVRLSVKFYCSSRLESSELSRACLIDRTLD